MKPNNENLPALASSFRDPAGFIFMDNKGTLFRQINQTGAADYKLLMESDLYNVLMFADLLVPHKEVPKAKGTAEAYAVIRPERVPHITYPFEWSFSQLRDAALLTLRIQKKALEHNMTLKDASAYNVQFVAGKPVFIDTLSFEKYVPGKPWQAYRQFCQHFLAPLLLMSYTDLRSSQMLRVYLDGVPLDLASRLLPTRTKLSLGIMMHIHMHASAQKVKATEHRRPDRVVSKNSLLAILDSLQRTIKKLHPQKATTEWGGYYAQTNYTAAAADKKAKLVASLVKPLKVKTALDLGGNNGQYSRVLNNLGIETVCADIDPNAVEDNYRYVVEHKESLMLPVVVDVTNPGGGLGWGNAEREVVHRRLQCDMVMALAIVHHLAISNNLPLENIAEYLRKFAPLLLIEFVPKSDSQVKKLLSTRQDVFPDYSEDGFVVAFKRYYKLVEKEKIQGTQRTLYVFRRK